eukprot:30075-Pyramimonas_sp.AAC.1
MPSADARAHPPARGQQRVPRGVPPPPRGASHAVSRGGQAQGRARSRLAVLPRTWTAAGRLVSRRHGRKEAPCPR